MNPVPNSYLSSPIQCPLISEPDAANWLQLAEIFEAAPVLPLGQSWLPVQEDDWRPAEVRLGWRGTQLWVWARLQDEAIYTAATANQNLLWLLGDTFEMFLRPSHQEAYFELHVAPNNLTMQVSLPDLETIQAVRAGTIELESQLVSEPLMRTWTQSSPGEWQVLAAVDMSALAVIKEDAPPRAWMVSFGRYDYTPGREEPVLSSTSAHQVCDFHDQSAWREIILV